MDPNANLREQAELLAILAKGAQRVFVETGEDARAIRRRLADLRALLAEWLQRGGFAPDWTRYPAASRYYGDRVGALSCGHFARVTDLLRAGSLDCPTCARLQAIEDAADDARLAHARATDN